MIYGHLYRGSKTFNLINFRASSSLFLVILHKCLGANVLESRFGNSLKPARIGNKNRMKYKTRAKDACRVSMRDKLIVYSGVSLAWVACRVASVHPRVEKVHSHEIC